jgi:hypothetical protein
MRRVLIGAAVLLMLAVAVVIWVLIEEPAAGHDALARRESCAL